jgi:hypothetical protein
MAADIEPHGELVLQQPLPWLQAAKDDLALQLSGDVIFRPASLHFDGVVLIEAHHTRVPRPFSLS